ncbi:putative 3-demethylubiquinone-9 3-methyltransferase (glyoxalase superfamily) [Paenibacillus taihuensis]|uniref:Putative 3-demethylubiquinone-9 3-methyltransferase (Glyoxalase superfamily) n=1 Tax=Paenibacillus taihuensis TaxID=1156355 RepID=A0A3D9RJW4_9BACL|nr:VOC family protein [Paenibacillus taihuensis]REE80173.1 putative 3-demethylubiquinone-9 3-methyltransferase (glyoxalase superfamily) [Paenibacillus taihuensis]
MSNSRNGSSITTHLWFDKEAQQAAEFYCSVFPDSSITSMAKLQDTPSGDCDMVSFNVFGHPFMSISAGPLFKLNPSISFIVNFDPSRDENSRELIDEVWNKLSDGGTALMALGKYPFSERYGWIQDKFGVSWQLMLTNPDGEPRPAIVTSLLFVGDKCGKAEAAREFYLSVFRTTRPGPIIRYGPGMTPDTEGTVMFTDFMLENSWFAAMDSAHNHGFQFNEAVSLMVSCENQEEIDYYWDKLSAVPAAEQCGWLKDQFGVSWQIVPSNLSEFMSKGTPEQLARVTQAFLKMKKFDLAVLEQAFQGE